jgi:hypothetical protein
VCIDCKSLYPIDSIHNIVALMNNQYIRCGNYYATSPNVVNPTKTTARYDGNCCNGDGSKIYWELTEEITDDTCDAVGACCGWKTYANPSGNLDDKTTCRMCHECECDTEKGEVWHGEGSSCDTNPCFCEGFKAFDGSEAYYRYARLIDEDTCYATNDRNDGYMIVQWTASLPCACGVTKANTTLKTHSGVVVETTGAYVDAYPIGSCYNIPAGYITESIYNSATFASYGSSDVCGNPGDKLGWMLYSAVTCDLNPLP